MGKISVGPESKPEVQTSLTIRLVQFQTSDLKKFQIAGNSAVKADLFSGFGLTLCKGENQLVTIWQVVFNRSGET